MQADDRLGWLAYVVFVPLAFLTAIFGPALVIFSESTPAYWAWEIRPEMSAVWVGGSYAFGAIAITVMLFTGRWRGVVVPVAATWTFSIVTLAATLLHQDRFFLGTLNYYVWLAIYLLLPVVLPLIWWLNRERDPGTLPDEALIPRAISMSAAALGGVVGLVSLLMVFSPSAGAGFWPWQLTPLMSRVIGAWLLFIATGLLCLLFERRVMAYRPYLLPAAMWFAVLFIASFFHLDNFDFSSARAWVWFGVAGGASVAALAGYLYLGRLYDGSRLMVLPRTDSTPVA
jgi:hypothetical protein